MIYAFLSTLLMYCIGVCVRSSTLAVTVLIAPVDDGDLSVYDVQLVFTDFAILSRVCVALVAWFENIQHKRNTMYEEIVH